MLAISWHIGIWKKQWTFKKNESIEKYHNQNCFFLWFLRKVSWRFSFLFCLRTFIVIVIYFFLQFSRSYETCFPIRLHGMLMLLVAVVGFVWLDYQLRFFFPAFRVNETKTRHWHRPKKCLYFRCLFYFFFYRSRNIFCAFFLHTLYIWVSQHFQYAIKILLFSTDFPITNWCQFTKKNEHVNVLTFHKKKMQLKWIWLFGSTLTLNVVNFLRKNVRANGW